MAGTQISTSRLGFGTASLHHLLSSAARQRLLQHARSKGIRYFDTAPLYGHESAERELGRFAKTCRAELVLTTKTGIVPGALTSRLPPLLYVGMAVRQLQRRIGIAQRTADKPRRNYAVGYTRNRIDRSLRLLGTDYIDVLYLHEPSLSLIPDPDALAIELERIKASGKVRHIGISGLVRDAIDIAARSPGLAEMLQLEASSPESDWTSLRRTGRAPHATFGHFRGRAAPDISTQSRDRWLRECLTEATRLNPEGVIVFSSRHAAHIDEAVKAMALIEPEV